MTDRSILFIDGNNWYHSLKNAGIRNLGSLNYAKVSEKLVGSRQWIGTRYYVGKVQQRGNPGLYSAQRRCMAWLEARDSRIKIIYGRLEPRIVTNDAAKELKQYLAELDVRIDQNVYRELVALANRHENIVVQVEKAVDVKLAVDMVRMAENNEYDVGYLLSADGDFTPAVEAAAEKGKKIFAASVSPGAQLAKEVYKFLPLSTDWLNDCFGE